MTPIEKLDVIWHETLADLMQAARDPMAVTVNGIAEMLNKTGAALTEAMKSADAESWGILDGHVAPALESLQSAFEPAKLHDDDRLKELAQLVQFEMLEIGWMIDGLVNRKQVPA